MTRMMYCPNCKQNVTIEPRCNMVVLVLLILMGILPGLFYYFWKKGDQCPICKTTDEFMEPYRKSEDD